MKEVVLITGCSSGIGHALSLEFYRRGFEVIATAINRDSLNQLEEAGITTLSLNVNERTQIAEVLVAIMRQNGSIDILINNAGFAQMGPIIEIPQELMQAQFQTNVFSPLYLSQQVVPIMKKAGKGLIVNMGSISGVATSPFSGPYCASKAAFHRFRCTADGTGSFWHPCRHRPTWWHSIQSWRNGKKED